MEKNKTAMQALVDLLKVNDIYKECMPYVIEIIDEVYLPMEREQIQEAYRTGFHHRSWGRFSDSERYYETTYGDPPPPKPHIPFIYR